MKPNFQYGKGCFVCGKQGHWANVCPMRSDENSAIMKINKRLQDALIDNKALRLLIQHMEEKDKNDKKAGDVLDKSRCFGELFPTTQTLACDESQIK
jgi:hypothetical protein